MGSLPRGVVTQLGSLPFGVLTQLESLPRGVVAPLGSWPNWSRYPVGSWPPWGCDPKKSPTLEEEERGGGGGRNQIGGLMIQSNRIELNRIESQWRALTRWCAGGGCREGSAAVRPRSAPPAAAPPPATDSNCPPGAEPRAKKKSKKNKQKKNNHQSIKKNKMQPFTEAPWPMRDVGWRNDFPFSFEICGNNGNPKMRFFQRFLSFFSFY